MDIDSGYWKLVEEEKASKRLAFFILEGNWQWKVMHMGTLNAAPTFVAMMKKIYMEWDTLDK